MVQYNLYCITMLSTEGKNKVFYVCAENIEEAFRMASRFASGREIKQIQNLNIRPFIEVQGDELPIGYEETQRIF